MAAESTPMDGNGAADAPLESSVTAIEYINRQLELEKEARELMPYSFETCTFSMGPLRQPVYACKQHSPQGGALCYSCSISCHGDCDLVELFNKRHIQCDCGTTRYPDSPCTLRSNITNDAPAETNIYSHNYHGRFCACDRDYDAAKETGTMYQCLLGDACNEDWFHDVCIVGESYEKAEVEGAEDGAPEGGIQSNGVLNEGVAIEDMKEENSNSMLNNNTNGVADDITAPANGDDHVTAPAATTDEDENEYDDDDDRPDGFPASSTFTNFICWLCVAKNPWLRDYAGTPGFLPAVVKGLAIAPKKETANSDGEPPTITDPQSISPVEHPSSKKRKASDEENLDSSMSDAPALKRLNKTPEPATESTTAAISRSASGEPISDLITHPQEPVAETQTPCTYPPPLSLPQSTPVSLFFTSPPHALPPTTFCRCPTHLPLLSPFPVLTSTEEETAYEPPLSRSASPTGSHHSILDMGERALNTIDRVRAIEGVMAYNHMKEKVREFLKPFAEGGGVVGPEDVRAYFEKLKEGMGGGAKGKEGGASGSGGGGNRKEQSGY